MQGKLRPYIDETVHPGGILTALGRPARTPEGVRSMEQHTRLVKGQIAWLESQIARFPPDHPKYRSEQVALYQRLANEHRELLAYLESREQPPAPAPPKSPPPLQSSPPSTLPSSRQEDFSDLPEELLSELSGRAARGENDPLVQIIADRGGMASLDEILIDLYRKRGQIGKRILIQNRLYRLSKHGAIWTLPGRKGVYTTQPQNVPGPES